MTKKKSEGYASFIDDLMKDTFSQGETVNKEKEATASTADQAPAADTVKQLKIEGSSEPVITEAPIEDELKTADQPQARKSENEKKPEIRQGKKSGETLVPVLVKLAPDMQARLDESHWRARKSVSNIIREAVDEWLQRNGY